MAPHNWSPKEEERLREIYPLMSNREIAKLFRVSKIAINHKTERLGLTESQKTYRIRRVACGNCGKTMKRPICALRHKNTFCSKNCYSEWQQTHTYRVCPQLTPSPDLAYVSGVLLGDGTCCKSFWGRGKRGKRAVVYLIDLEVTERLFAQSFSEALQRLGLNPRIYNCRKKGNRRDTWFVKAYSKKFYQWWTQQNMATCKEIFLADKSLTKEFIRGFFESEGSYYIQDHVSYYQTHCQMANTDLDRIKLFAKAISYLTFKTSIYTHREQRKNRKEFHYVIRILGGKSENARFIESIKPCIKNRLS